eukprot:CAMPEP_0176471884 /NCGR_PEP_ID=MMETSP0127-20121128/41412_1 /TAXON_ID=938130 /ORGANISM="Platyophrya macrostoma, Strain WH" /LENGTH=114 /DNA_ID=CAMNT_0017866645 /DNA_START=448 /DNA_END=789 /DNA_ORIENTATION=-
MASAINLGCLVLLNRTLKLEWTARHESGAYKEHLTAHVKHVIGDVAGDSGRTSARGRGRSLQGQLMQAPDPRHKAVCRFHGLVQLGDGLHRLHVTASARHRLNGSCELLGGVYL